MFQEAISDPNIFHEPDYAPDFLLVIVYDMTALKDLHHLPEDPSRLTKGPASKKILCSNLGQSTPLGVFDISHPFVNRASILPHDRVDIIEL